MLVMSMNLIDTYPIVSSQIVFEIMKVVLLKTLEN
jgi:hypothetical protein